MLAHLKEDGNFEEFTESLNWIQINSANQSAFSFKIFTGRPLSWEALVALKPLISFKTVFLSMQEKLKFETWWRKHLMEIILGFSCN